MAGDSLSGFSGDVGQELPAPIPQPMNMPGPMLQNSGLARFGGLLQQYTPPTYVPRVFTPEGASIESLLMGTRRQPGPLPGQLPRRNVY